MTKMPDDPTLSAAERRLRHAACEGCAESRLLMSRRAMLGVTAGLFSWAFMPRFAEAASAGGDPRLLIVVLRGGMDGINTVVPFGDSHYVSMRGDIAIPRASTIRLDSFFGLHPALKNFGDLYKADEAAVVHAACVPLHNRSHFDTQDNLENGLPDLAANATGWLNRLLTTLPAGSPIRSGGAIQIGDAPLIMRGPAPVLGWSPTWFTQVDNPILYMIRTLYRDRDPALLRILEHGLKADRLAERVDEDDGQISTLRKGFRGAGRLVAASDGPRIAVLSVGGFDTHSGQGAADGMLADVLGELDAGIGDFRTAVGAAWGQTVMVLATEFGRTVRVNGDDGTDHGVGTAVLLAGGAVNGGKVFGDWPGLAPNRLYENSDLRPTTDLRAVFKGVLKDHLGVPGTLLNSTIFPESAGVAPMRNLVKAGAPGASGAQIAGLSAAKLHSEPPIARYRKGLRVSRAAML
jgi:uncharacterized protein (DUF1501 family)